MGFNQVNLKTPGEKTGPEIELLLHCARTFVGPADGQRIGVLLHQKLDWAYLLRTAGRHGLTPLLYQTLHTTCPGDVPQAVLELLHHLYRRNTQANIALTQELLNLLKLFEQHGIRALPFKGPVLAVAVYGNLSLRQFTDLDILVQEQDMVKAKKLLLSQGYRQIPLWTRAQEAAHAQIRHHDVFFKPNGKIVVELHWRLLDKGACFPADRNDLWERIEQISLLDGVVNTFSAADLLLFLCAHGSKYGHGWGRLSWIIDVAELIQGQPGLDWPEVMARADRLGCKRRLLLGLCLAGHLVNTTLPEPIEHQIQADPMVKQLAGQVFQRLFRETDDLFGSFTQFYFHLRIFERRQDGLRCALISIIAKWAIQSRIGFLSPFYTFIDGTRAKNVWIWPLPLFAVLYFFHDLLLPIYGIAKNVWLRGRAWWVKLTKYGLFLDTGKDRV